MYKLSILILLLVSSCTINPNKYVITNKKFYGNYYIYDCTNLKSNQRYTIFTNKDIQEKKVLILHNNEKLIIKECSNGNCNN